MKRTIKKVGLGTSISVSKLGHNFARGTEGAGIKEWYLAKILNIIWHGWWYFVRVPCPRLRMRTKTAIKMENEVLLIFNHRRSISYGDRWYISQYPNGLWWFQICDQAKFSYREATNDISIGTCSVKYRGNKWKARRTYISVLKLNELARNCQSTKWNPYVTR